MKSGVSTDSYVTVPPWWPGPAPAAVTHRDEPEAAAASGEFPTATAGGGETPGSILEIGLSNWWGTQTVPPATTTPDGPSPTGIVAAMWPLAGSMLETVPSSV